MRDQPPLSHAPSFKAGALRLLVSQIHRARNMKITKGALWGAFLPAFAVTALTQNVSPLPEIVITAKRHPQPENTIPANVSVITADDIQKSPARNISDILRYQSGIEVTDMIGASRQASVDIRGFGAESAPNNTLVLMDGRRLNSSVIPEVDWSAIPLDQIDRIEVVRGGGSVLYGDKAVGGVIHIITKKGAAKNLLTSDTSFASFNTLKQSLSLSGSQGPIGYFVGGGFSESDGYRINNFFRNKTSNLAINYNNGSPFSLSANVSLKQDKYGMPGWSAANQSTRSSSTPKDYAGTEGYSFAITPKLTLSEDFELELGIQNSNTQYSAYWDSSKKRYAWQVLQTSISPKAVWKFQALDLQHEVTLGLDLSLAERGNGKKDDYAAYGKLSGTQTGVYINDTVQLIPEKLLLDLGYRYTRAAYDFQKANENFDIHSQRYGLTYLLDPQSKLFASVDKSFRTAVFENDSVFGPSGKPSDILTPQTSWTYQIGAKKTLCKYFSSSLTGFIIKTSDEIFYDPIAGNSNYPKTNRKGIELGFESDPLNSLHCFANYTLLDAKLGSGSYSGKSIPATARHAIQTGMVYSPCKFIDLDLRGRWLTGRYGISDWKNQQKHWDGSEFLTVDSKVTLKPHPWLKVYAGVNNMFNQRYSEYGAYDSWGMTPLNNDVVRYPSAKRNFIAGLVLTHEF